MGSALLRNLPLTASDEAEARLYPTLHARQRKGYLRSREKGFSKTARRLYRATAQGRAVLEDANENRRELVGARRPNLRAKHRNCGDVPAARG